jgi:hypothetical protein
MTFYEELGVPPDASSDTIREAYRNVAKVLHPDSQTNPALKQAAEVQMKRVNHLYEVLSDPDQRRAYDHNLAEPTDRTVIIQAPAPSGQFRRGHAGNFTWLAATAVCGTLIIWLATRESAGPAVYSPSAPAPAAATGAVAIEKATVAKTAPAVVAQDHSRDAETARLRGELVAAYAERDRLRRQVADLQSALRPAAISPAPLVASTAPVDLGLPVLRPIAPPTPKSLWTGAWGYIQRTENKNQSLIPPEFIQADLVESGGNLRGQYRARYKVADRRVFPVVEFQFEGKISGSSGRFAWHGLGGAKGEVQIRLVSDSMLEVSWSATDLGKSMGLASGTAVLNRQ